MGKREPCSFKYFTLKCHGVAHCSQTGKVLIYGGSRYQKSKQTSKAIYWRCWCYTCGGGVKTNCFDINAEAPAIEVLHESCHAHLEVNDKITKDKTKNQLKDAVREDATRTIKRVFDAVAAALFADRLQADPSVRLSEHVRLLE